jgi:hypothetical protein
MAASIKVSRRSPRPRTSQRSSPVLSERRLRGSDGSSATAIQRPLAGSRNRRRAAVSADHQQAPAWDDGQESPPVRPPTPATPNKAGVCPAVPRLLGLVPGDRLTGTFREARFRSGEGRRLPRKRVGFVWHVVAGKACGRWLVWLMKERGVALEGRRDSLLIADGVRVLEEPADDGNGERGQLARRGLVGAVCGEAVLDGRQPIEH